MSLIAISELLRMQRDRDWMEAVEGWQSSTGEDRAYWRGRVRRCIAAERYHRTEGQALVQATAAASHRRAA